MSTPTAAEAGLILALLRAGARTGAVLLRGADGPREAATRGWTQRAQQVGRAMWVRAEAQGEARPVVSADGLLGCPVQIEGHLALLLVLVVRDPDAALVADLMHHAGQVTLAAAGGPAPALTFDDLAHAPDPHGAVAAALAAHDGCKTRLARALAVPRRRLYRLLDIAAASLAAQAVALAAVLRSAGRRGGVRDDKAMRAAFARTCAAAGLPRLTPHALRHTYASLQLQRGAPVQYVQRQLGHAAITMTVDRYGSWLPAGDRTQALALEGILERGGQTPRGGDVSVECQ